MLALIRRLLNNGLTPLNELINNVKNVVDTLSNRLTETRAGYIDTINTNVSSVKNKVDNTTYGLEAIKNTLNNVFNSTGKYYAASRTLLQNFDYVNSVVIPDQRRIYSSTYYNEKFIKMTSNFIPKADGILLFSFSALLKKKANVRYNFGNFRIYIVQADIVDDATFYHHTTTGSDANFPEGGFIAVLGKGATYARESSVFLSNNNVFYDYTQFPYEESVATTEKSMTWSKEMLLYVKKGFPIFIFLEIQGSQNGSYAANDSLSLQLTKAQILGVYSNL